MNLLQRIVIIALVIVGCIGCDQATKSIAREELSPRQSLTLLGDHFHLKYTENGGAMLGIGSDLPPVTRFWLFIVFTACALLTILTFTVVGTKLGAIDVLSLSLVLGGGLSNLADRLFKGGVVIDFMVISVGPIKTAIFNCADLMIFGGLIALLALHFPRTSGPTQTTTHS